LRKSIANDFNKATLFCNAPELAASDLRFLVQRRSFLQASDHYNGAERLRLVFVRGLECIFRSIPRKPDFHLTKAGE
jgi:hypothetical protein